MVLLSSETTVSKLFLLISERDQFYKERVCFHARIKGNGHTFKGDNSVKTVFCSIFK